MKKSPKKILIIDDDPGMIKVLTKWLKVAGREVVSAYYGKTGLKMARTVVPDLILIDLMLPDIGGLDVARQLKADAKTRDIPFIFISAYIGLENDKGDEQLEIDGVKYSIFAKPLHNAKLLSEIRKSINRRLHKNPEPQPRK